jgi:glycosyltransferase involved in cell wall biosynthesis
VVVDDGSSDDTADIARRMGEAHPWIRLHQRPDRGERKVGGGVVETFDAGLEQVQAQDYDYLVKLDADLTLPPGYFERIMEYMEADPLLGSASGKVYGAKLDGTRLYEEYIIDEMVAGQVKFYRRECFEDIGGLVRNVMWDGIDFHRARMCGWRTRSFRDPDIEILHHRLMGSSHRNIYHGRRRWGRGQWFMGTHPLYIIASGVFRMRERPFVLGGLNIIIGYFDAMRRGEPRYDDLAFRARLHRWQLERLGLGFLAPRVSPHFDHVQTSDS